MTSYQITIDVDTPEEAEEVMNKIQDICKDIIEGGGEAAEKYAHTIIPKRSGRLAGGTVLTSGGDMFNLSNGVYYGPFVDKGHRIVVHRRRHPPHQVGYFGGRHFSDAIWTFVQDDINNRCMAFLALK